MTFASHWHPRFLKAPVGGNLTTAHSLNMFADSRVRNRARSDRAASARSDRRVASVDEMGLESPTRNAECISRSQTFGRRVCEVCRINFKCKPSNLLVNRSVNANFILKADCDRFRGLVLVEFYRRWIGSAAFLLCGTRIHILYCRSLNSENHRRR